MINGERLFVIILVPSSAIIIMMHFNIIITTTASEAGNAVTAHNTCIEKKKLIRLSTEAEF